jgi:hypothetical protein
MKPNQDDREAAADDLAGSMTWWDAKPVLAGEKDDHPKVQKYMRHRLAGMELARAEAARVAADFARCAKEQDKAADLKQGGYANACDDLKAAILAIDLDALGEKE